MNAIFDGTDLARIELPDQVTGFGSAEMVFLSARYDSDAMKQSRELLGIDLQHPIDWTSNTADLIGAGASSLIARGLAIADPDSVRPLAEAALLEYVAGTAQRWTRITAIGEQRADLGMILQAPEVTAVLQPRAVGSWFVALDDMTAPAELLMRFIEMLEQTDPRSGFALAAWRIDEGPEMLFCSFDGSAESWGVLDGEDPEAAEPQTLTRGALLGRLTKLVAD